MSVSRHKSKNLFADEYEEAVAWEMHQLGATIERLRKWRFDPQYADLIKREVPVLNFLSARLVQTVHALKTPPEVTDAHS